MNEVWRQRGKMWLASCGIWTFVGLAHVAAVYVSLVQRNQPVSLRFLLADYLPFFYKWLPVSPLIFRLGRLFPLEEEKWWSRLALHLILALDFHFLATPLTYTLTWYLAAPEVLRATEAPTLGTYLGQVLRLPSLLLLDFFVYWVVLIVGWWLAYYRKYRAGETRAALLAAQLAQAQLQALKMQLHPHFLFNTLNSIAALLHEDIEAADQMIARLGHFLRLTLDNSGTQMTTLRQELEILRHYLDIERVRFQDRLTVEIQAAPEVQEAAVPNLLLQPLVENAIRHGIARQAGVGLIRVRAYAAGAKLRLEIADNGPGLAAPRRAEGVGLSNTRARLQQLYADDYLLELRQSVPRGLIVALEIPLEHRRLTASETTSVYEGTKRTA